MNETILWLFYCLSAAAAFATVYYLRWRIVTSMLAGTAVTLIGWALLYQMSSEEERPPFVTLDATLNGCFGLIFAAAGSAAAFALAHRRG